MILGPLVGKCYGVATRCTPGRSGKRTNWNHGGAACKKCAKRYNNSTLHRELVNAGYFQKPDPITTAPTAIRRSVSGFAASSGHAGTPANGADFPRAVRSRDQETHRQIKEARKRIESLTGGNASSVSYDLLTYLVKPDKQIDDPQLTKLIYELRQRIPVVSRNVFRKKFESLGSGVEVIVYLDTQQEAVYKLTPTADGEMITGIGVGPVYEVNRAGNLWVGFPESNPTVLDYLQRISNVNRQDNMVYTEIAAVTHDGDVVVKQPYIFGLNLNEPNDIFRHLRKLGLQHVRTTNAGMPTAVGKANGQLVLFVDLHEANVMVDDNGIPFIVDAANRTLTNEEAEIVREAVNWQTDNSL